MDMLLIQDKAKSTIYQEEDFADIFYFSDRKLAFVEWKRQPTLDEYKRTFSTLIEMVKQNRAFYFLSDVRSQGLVSPEIMKWGIETLNLQKHRTSLKKAAAVMDQNPFQEYYIASTRMAVSGSDCQFATFPTVKEALDWFSE